MDSLTDHQCIGLWIILPFYSIYDLLVGHTLRAAGTVKALVIGLVGGIIGLLLGAIAGLVPVIAVWLLPIPIVPIIFNLILSIALFLVSWMGVALILAVIGYAIPMRITVERDTMIVTLFGRVGRAIGTIVVNIPMLLLRLAFLF